MSPAAGVEQHPDRPNCPKCGGDTRLAYSKLGYFYACARYPACDGLQKCDGVPKEIADKSRKSNGRRDGVIILGPTETSRSRQGSRTERRLPMRMLKSRRFLLIVLVGVGLGCACYMSYEHSAHFRAGQAYARIHE